jgi:hypothetical protein
MQGNQGVAAAVERRAVWATMARNGAMAARRAQPTMLRPHLTLRADGISKGWQS